jgi:hypothetical protein
MRKPKSLAELPVWTRKGRISQAVTLGERAKRLMQRGAQALSTTESAMIDHVIRTHLAKYG